MAARRITKISLLIFSICALTSCDLGIEIPDYFIDVRTKDLELAYDDWSNVEIEFKFTAENQQHRCRYTLTNGNAVEFESELTDLLDAGIWHTLPFFNVTSPEEGKYNVRVIVQSETPDGQLIDLSFLNKAVVFYFDHTGPGVADISPTPAISSQPIDVELNHPDHLDPNASPVTLYYTIDGSDPTTASTVYTDKFQIGVSDIPIEVRVLAVDSVDQPGPVVSFTYNFMDIQSANPSIISISPSIQGIYIYGFGLGNAKYGGGFDDVTIPDGVELYDGDGTRIRTTIGSHPEDTQIEAAVFFNNILGGGNGIFDHPGPGTIEIIDISGETDTYPITFID